MAEIRFPGESHESRRARALRTRVEDLRDARQRILAAADEERRRIERDLHDGAQQRLVAVTLTLRLAEARLASDPASAAQLVTQAREEAQLAIEELRELARGIHPALLSDRGLGAALEALATRAPVPVQVSGVPSHPLCEPVEACAYFVTAEALTNVAKYAHANRGLRAALTRGRLPPPAGSRRRRRRRGPVDGKRPPRSPRPRRRTGRSPRARLTARRRNHRHRRDPGRARAQLREAAIERTGGRFVATSNQLVPASPDPKTVPEVAPK